MRALILLFMISSAVCAADGGDAMVISAEDIAREKPAGLMELLRLRVGLDVNNSAITMRGVVGIAVFVDGFASSVTELESLKPDQVERVEILRGAASARFGAEAMGGAVAVTTRAAHRLHAEASQGYDSRHGRFTRVGGGREDGGLGWSLMGEDRTRHGFRAVPSSPFPYQITVSDEGSKATLLDGRLGWQSRDLDLSLNLKSADNKSFLGRPYWAFSWQVDDLRLRGTWRLFDGVSLEAAFGEERYASAGSRDHGTGVDAAGLAPQSWLALRYRQREGTAALAWSGEGRSLRIGANVVDLSEQFVNSDYATHAVVTNADSAIRKTAIFIAAERSVGDGRLELGLRQDWHHYLSFRMVDAGPPAQTVAGGGNTKSATSPKITLAWPLGSGYRLRGSIATGFSPPQASQLYNRYVSAGAVTLANPGLKPERSVTADGSLGWTGADGDWNLTLFATDWRDKIATRIVDDGMPVVQQAQNVGRVAARGLEAQWMRHIAAAWSLTANYTYNRTHIVRDLSDPALVGKALPDMPRHKGNLALSWEPGTGFAGRASVRAVGSAFTDETNTVTDAAGYRWKKAGYAVLDLAATWRRPAWEFTLALDNALNRDYVTGFFWHGEPRTLRGEITLRY